MMCRPRSIIADDRNAKPLFVRAEWDSISSWFMIRTPLRLLRRMLTVHPHLVNTESAQIPYSNRHTVRNPYNPYGLQQENI